MSFCGYLEHSKIKKELEELNGAITFTYCLKCKDKIEYSGPRWIESHTLYTFQCFNIWCLKAQRFLIDEGDSWEEIWECPSCGWMREITQRERVN